MLIAAATFSLEGLKQVAGTLFVFEERKGAEVALRVNAALLLLRSILSEAVVEIVERIVLIRLASLHRVC